MIDSVDLTYEITTEHDTIFKIGDTAILKGHDGIDRETTITSLSAANKFVIKGQGNVTTTQTYTIQRLLNKGRSNTFTDLEKYSTDVQNVYKKGDDLLVTSPSIPSYNEQPLNVSTRSVVFSGTFRGNTFK